LEAERVRKADTPKLHHIDGYLLVLAIRQVLRSAEAMNEAVGGDDELTSAQDRFLDEQPQAAAARDALTHFDNYEAGKGKLQK
jgi:hypothetical protein